MGDVISIGDSIGITIFSMMIVFVELIVLAFLISILKNIGKEKKLAKKDAIKEEPVKEGLEPLKIEKKEENEEELIAVIAAAVAASLGLSIPEVNIKSIRRLSDEGPLWAQAGKQERIFGKL